MVGTTRTPTPAGGVTDPVAVVRNKLVVLPLDLRDVEDDAMGGMSSGSTGEPISLLTEMG